jgi:nucleoside diphosphate kinase
MGASASVSVLSSEQIASLLSSIDADFQQYADAVHNNNIDGSVLQTLNTEESIADFFRDIGITNEAHLKKISAYLLASHINSALIFIKPHANNPNVQSLVSNSLTSQGFRIAADGEITAEEIDSKQLIDNHYYSIASKATLLEPKDLPVPSDKFEAFFGESFESALSNGNVYNAAQAAQYLGLDAITLEKEWRKAKEKTVKFGGGFYCAKLDNIDGKQPIYVFNGFFMSMRSDFVIPGTSIHYYVVEWNPRTTGVSWGDFRKNVLGATDPSTSVPGSLRGQIMANWQSLGLPEQPSTGKNGVHGSASPLEGLNEKGNWLRSDIYADPFGRSLIEQCGVSNAELTAWCKDSPVQVEGSDGTRSVFDYFEDTDVDDCYDKAKLIVKSRL